MVSHASAEIRDFFAWSEWLDYMVFRPLSHIAPNWETSWDDIEKRYLPEPESFADDFNQVIELVATSPRPTKYHSHEDLLAENVIRNLKWRIQKKNNRWVGSDYAFILEQGAFSDMDQRNLIAAAAGRVHSALDYGQRHFDDMEDGHQKMLAALLITIIYHRHCDGKSLLIKENYEDIEDLS